LGINRGRIPLPQKSKFGVGTPKDNAEEEDRERDGKEG